MSGKTKKLKDVITIGLPEGWREQLEKAARKESFERDVTLTWSDLLREAAEEKYHLNSGDQNEQERE